MKKYSMFYYPFLFSDHMAKVSDKAKLYYIAINFHAINGFVADPLQVLDSLGYDKGVFNELVANEEILTLPDRDEIFITSYFVHNRGLKPMSWLSTPFAPYWKGKLFIKKDNGVATFKPQGEEPKEVDPLDKIQTPKDHEPEEVDKPGDEYTWDEMMNELNGRHK